MNNLKAKLKAKLKKQGGFTLIEMLIVVAIIAILIAIAIPMVNKALENAREATDSANERAALGLAYVDIMADDSLILGSGSNTAYYQISNNRGQLVESADDITPYGKSTAAGDMPDHVGKYLKVTYHETAGGTGANAYEAGDVTVEWWPNP